MHTELARQALLMAFTATAAWFDCRDGRIPNWLSVAGFALAIGWTVLFVPADAWLSGSAVAFAIGFGALFCLYYVGGVGGGDVKMMAGFSLLAGYPGIIYCLFFGCLAAGALMLVPLAWRGELLARLRAGLRRGKGDGAAAPLSVSFALALVIGVVWVVIMEAL